MPKPEQRATLGGETHAATPDYLAENTLPEELILVKGSIAADHLERIFLSQLDQVVCWRERCGRQMPCPDCGAYRKPSPPPLGHGNNGAARQQGEAQSGARSNAPAMFDGQL